MCLEVHFTKQPQKIEDEDMEHSYGKTNASSFYCSVVVPDHPMKSQDHGDHVQRDVQKDLEEHIHQFLTPGEAHRPIV